MTWAWLLCRILANDCSGVSKVMVRFMVKVRVRDRCVQGLKCPRTEMTVHQFGSIYGIATVQCMYADYVVWGDGLGGLVDDF